MTTSLTQLLHNRVLAEEIDELGHLSVPFYESRALAASRRLAMDLGCPLADLTAQGIEFTLVDAYLRNLREQFEGAPVMVQGGVLEASSTRLRFYQELVNTDDNQLAATFVHEFELRSHDMSKTLDFSEEVVDQARASAIAIPAHGKPRTINMDTKLRTVTLDEARGLNLPCTGPRSVEAEECDELGLYQRERFASLPYTGLSEEDLTMEWVFTTSDGRTLGIADLESRNVLHSLPRVGEQVQVFSANVALGEKVLQRGHWVFNVTTGELVSIAMTVSLPLDLEARRSVPIPDDMRARMEQQFHPELL